DLVAVKISGTRKVSGSIAPRLGNYRSLCAVFIPEVHRQSAGSGPAQNAVIGSAVAVEIDRTLAAELTANFAAGIVCRMNVDIHSVRAKRSNLRGRNCRRSGNRAGRAADRAEVNRYGTRYADCAG